MSCPACKEAMKFKGYRPKDVVSLLGVMTLERGYYHCQALRRVVIFPGMKFCVYHPRL